MKRLSVLAFLMALAACSGAGTSTTPGATPQMAPSIGFSKADFGDRAATPSERRTIGKQLGLDEPKYDLEVVAASKLEFDHDVTINGLPAACTPALPQEELNEIQGNPLSSVFFAGINPSDDEDKSGNPNIWGPGLVNQSGQVCFQASNVVLHFDAHKDYVLFLWHVESKDDGDQG